MTKSRPDVPDAELAVLKALWSRGASTIREITDELYPGGDVSHYGTVQKLLDRLYSRQYVTRKRKGNVNVFAAKVARDDLIRNRLKDTADRLCEGSLTPLLTQLVQAKGLSEDEIAELRAMIDQLETEGDSA